PTGRGGAGADRFADLAGVPVVAVGHHVDLGLVGEREEFQQVVVGDAPVHLGAPEAVVGLVPEPAGATGVAVLGIAVAGLVHGEQEQAVLDDRARAPDVRLGEAAPVAAGAAGVGRGGAVGVGRLEVVVLRAGLPCGRLEVELHDTLEPVSARAGI